MEPQCQLTPDCGAQRRQKNVFLLARDAHLRYARHRNAQQDMILTIIKHLFIRELNAWNNGALYYGESRFQPNGS